MSGVRLFGAGVALLAALLALACVVYPPQYVYRVLAWRDADANDHQRFPSRAIAPAARATELPQRLAPAAVHAAWSAAGGEGDMPSAHESLGTQAFIVLRDGQVLYEGYFNGMTRDQWVTSFSVAKSFLSALLGIAESEGAIRSLDDPVTDWLPELAARDARFRQVRLRHLLDMASGLQYEEFPFLHGDDAKTYYHPDLRALALAETRIVGEPGRQFHYNNYHPLLLGMVLERATKMTVAAYLQSRIWQPAGMTGPASWSLDSESSGFEKMESGLNARAIDFARFGQLMLDGGRAGGVQVVPGAWAAASTSPAIPAPPADYFARSEWTRAAAGRYYHAMWWGQQRPRGGHDFAARGNHGQLIFVSPANRVVIVRHGTRYGMDSARWFELSRRMADELGRPATTGGS